MKKLGFMQLLSDELQAPIIITFTQPNHTNFIFEQFYNKLSERGFLIYPGKLTVANTFRIGCIGDLNSNDMYATLEAIKETIKELNIKLN